ncbi:SusC/RagA family TonB-linked outer membrane protein [Niastella yeongjuensis]|uniref:SusC/RagA family TonB-linked outer membrane protein n=1 Tax=Niastella yeongjuensis TaxID=354355 RepID=A0A1V9F8F4_9BACT|nr:SusC/RagA family TonB-linked outer membrane protein [Niastella yeongjuensis]OQP54644.1 SusC/RagA family TonB-linked outer membrane protein [Niastella yeongjuensis]SEO02062.1 TonB-linked outer membrane protein, SusC/RagA family [Niastella yeongjuensis]
MTQFLSLRSRSVKAVGLLLFCQLMVSLTFAQVRISGKVTGTGNQALAGISVTVKNTNFGTATDPSGNYSINAALKPGNYSVEFSGVGFKKASQNLTVSSADKYTVNITLAEDALGLEEVVVTGTSEGTTRKQVGSYISTVKADQLNKGATGNVLAALQGKTAGAQIIQNSGDPAGGISVRLRGVGSVNSSSDPLYIVDGVIINNATNRVTNTQNSYDGTNFIGTVGQSRMVDINPADIDHIEVLNGAAASAIYGSRANNGVIQIFTKRGSTGAPVVSFATSIMTSHLRKKLDVNEAPVKFGGPTDGPGALTQDLISTVGTPPALPTNTTPVTRYDYQDYIFQTGLGTDNNVSVSGGKDKTKYFTSASYFYNEGIIKNTDFKRFSFRANLDQELNSWANMSIGMNYVNSTSDEKPDGNSFFSPMNSVTIIGNFHNIWQRDVFGNLLAVGERGRVNPVSVIEDFKQKQETNRLIANAKLKIRPAKGLSFDYTMGIDNYSQRGTTFMPPYTYNVNTAFWGGGDPINPTLNGYASTGANTFFQINHEVNGTYQTNINDNLASTTQVGYSVQYEKNNLSILQGRGMTPFIQTVNSASTVLPGTDNRTEFSVSGAYLQQNFKFKDQLFVTGAVRVDGASAFDKDERNQVYVKASGSYLLSETDFWSKLNVSKWWNVAKVRVAYGESGNLTGIGPYDRFNSYITFPYVGRTSFSSQSQLSNEKMRPEKQRELELGTDLSFFTNRLNLQFNYYIKKVDHLLIARNIAPTNGYSSLLDNYGALENKGFEVMLTGTPYKDKDWNLDVTVIYNHNRNKAKDIGKAAAFSTNAGAPVYLIQDQPVGVFYGTFFAVDASGNQVKNSAGFPQTEKGIQNDFTSYTPQRDANGLPTGTTLRKIIGDPNPDWTGSAVAELSYKKLGLRVQFDAVQGLNVWNADFRTRQGVGNGKVAEQEDLGLLPRGYINSVYQIEEWRVDDGSFVKLREINLRYNFGKVKVFSDLTLSVSGRNLVSWDDYKGYDPEVNSGGQSTLLRAIDFGTVPIPRTFSFNIAAKF